jgi:hypothetical protein
MARKLRVQYPGAIYHVMNRGDRREAIFNDDNDRRLFLSTLGEACEKTRLAGARLLSASGCSQRSDFATCSYPLHACDIGLTGISTPLRVGLRRRTLAPILGAFTFWDLIRRSPRRRRSGYQLALPPGCDFFGVRSGGPGGPPRSGYLLRTFGVRAPARSAYSENRSRPA